MKNIKLAKKLDPLTSFRALSKWQKISIVLMLFMIAIVLAYQGSDIFFYVLIVYIIASYGKDFTEPPIEDQVKGKVIVFQDAEGTEKMAYVDQATREGENLRIWCKAKQGYRMIAIDSIIRIED